MEGANSGNKCVTFSILTVCLVFFVVQINQMVKICKALSSSKYSTKVYINCILPQNILQIASVIFSILFILCLSFTALSIQYWNNFFRKRILSPFLSLVYLIFGIYLSGCSLYAFLKWDSSMYFCSDNPDKKIFSWSYFLPVCLTCLIGTFTIVMNMFLNTVGVYRDSILKKEGGFNFIRLLFWKTVLGDKMIIFNKKNNKENNNGGNEEQENLLNNNDD